MKRALDVVLATFALAVLAPLLGTLALIVRIDAGRPILFRQSRSGRGGAPFTLLKFRTMTVSESTLWDPSHDKVRVTRTGRWLRATSLDELPSLVNVVRGEMSLVGPRPLPVQYLARYDDRQARRLEVRPGVTGWAQVNGRNATTWDDRLAMDVWYVEHRSLPLDLRILASTLRAVVAREGIDQGAGVTMTEFSGTRSDASRDDEP
ncbi:MAG: sugar transferase [Actinomycetota bacterium]|nr:sugar transferase [Actinomycetota bacterium]